jgi:type II secretion system protein L
MTQAAVIDRNNLGLALAGLDIDHVTVVGGELTDIEAGQAKNKLEAETIELDESGVLGYLASQFRDAAVGGTFINILQGEYQAERARSQAFSRWQSVIGLAAIWLVIAFLGMVAQGYWAEGQADQLETDSFAFYKNVFPRESQPVSVDQLRRRMASKLGKKSTGGTESAFVGLVSQFASVLGPNHLVSSISYAEQRRELNIEVLLKDYDEIDSLKEKLASSGVIMEPTNAEQEDNQVRSRMKLRYAD